MTAVTTSPPTPQRFGNVLSSEWTKLRTLRSNTVALVLVILGTVGVAALVCGETAAHWSTTSVEGKTGIEPANLSVSGWYLSQLIVGVVAVLTFTSEHGSGLIRTTFAAVPRRGRVFAAKALVVTASVLSVALACSFASFFLGQRLLRSTGVATTLGHPGVTRIVIGSALFATLIALLGLGLGAIVRSTAGAISTLFGLLFVPPILADAFPPSWHQLIQRYSPLNAGSQIMNLHRPVNHLGPWAGLLVLAVYSATALVVAFVVVPRRDV